MASERSKGISLMSWTKNKEKEEEQKPKLTTNQTQEAKSIKGKHNGKQKNEESKRMLIAKVGKDERSRMDERRE